MTHRLITLTMTLLLLADVRRSFVDPAPLDSAPGTGHAGRDAPLDFDEVKQLEDLKHSFGKTFSVLKTHTSVYSDVNGRRQGHSESKEQVNNDGKLMARVDQKVDSAQEPGATPATLVRTELDIPDRGVHKTLLQSDLTESVERRSAPGDSANNLDKLSSYSGIQYSPLDMAEYVFWTGDEKGVTLAIEEFLQEGLMSRDEAISFLQDIKFNLEYLQAHYAQQRLHKQEEQLQAKERASLLQKALGLDKTRTLDNKQSNELATDLLLSKKSSTDLPTTVSNREVSISQSQQQTLGLSDQDYEELLERLRVADFLYTEYSLEEVIYQLAKVMFSQSLNRGSGEAQEALQKFTSFLESEAEQGHISRSLEKKVLDVLIASLTDTLTEHPHLVSAAREGLGSNLPKTAGNQLLHQLLLLNPAGASGETASAGTDINKSDKSHQSTLAKTREMMAAAAESNKAT